MKNRAVFSDAAGSSMGFNSTWQRRGDNVSTECQTSKELYQFSETETQSGIATEVVQNQVRSKDDGTTLLDYYCKTHPNRPREVWREGISRGKVTVDCEVTTNVDAIVHSDYFLEYVNFSSDKETQTAPLIQTLSDPTSSSSRQSRRRGESKTEYSEEDEYKDQKDEGYDQEGKWNETKSNSGGSAMTAAMAASLGRLADLVERELESAAQSTAFEGYTIQNSSQNTEEDADVSYWRGLSVDLEKRKVVYPDWTAAKHQAGRLVGCTLSRNRERLYDVEFEDGVRITSVREEHIRLVGEPDSANTVPKHEVSKGRGPPSAAKDGGSKSSSLREGMRVHARAVIRGKTKYLPGRIVKAKAGRFDVECEGSADVQRDLTADDLVVGLGDSATVECRRPVCVQLQATGVSWNATGASLATSYGRTDITGWCDYPGAVCVWNIFGKAFDATQPDYVLDHPSCLLCVAFHPTHPALVAAGSFNGEVVLWDLSVPDHPAMVSPIAEHVHKEPVVNLQWVKALDDEWMLCSAGADGKVLFWCPASGLKHPTTGATLTKGKAARKQYPAAYGATAVAFAGGSGSALRPAWVLCGQEGGAIIRGQMSRISSSPRITLAAFQQAQSSSAESGFYPPLRRADEAFLHSPHSGPVTGLEFSPFSRNLFLSAGGDGTVRLYHLLDASPLCAWEPTPPPGTQGLRDSDAFHPLTSVAFSPTRPLVFAAGSGAGMVYLFDLLQSEAGPVGYLETPISTVGEGAASRDSGRTKSRQSMRAAITSLSFNRKQRGLLAACDARGQVHIWKLGWGLTSMGQGEMAAAAALEGMAGSRE